MSMEQAAPFDPTKPHTTNAADGKISTIDQGGHLYDGLTHMVLTSTDAEKYCIPKGAPFSKVKTTHERIEDAINTIKASGAIDPDTLSKFDKMFQNMLLEKEPKPQPKPEPPKK